MKKLVLISNSPRRRELLKGLGIPVAIRKNRYEETAQPHTTPRSFVLKSALDKLRYAPEALKNEVLITADTIVYFRGSVIGKPHSYKEAFTILKKMVGTYHTVYTGLAVKDGESGKTLSDYAKTRVYFAGLNDREIQNYLHHINPLDKAGAYAIQNHGALLVTKIEGCYYNVMGLPLFTLSRLLKKININLLHAHHTKP